VLIVNTCTWLSDTESTLLEKKKTVKVRLGPALLPTSPPSSHGKQGLGQCQDHGNAGCEGMPGRALSHAENQIVGTEGYGTGSSPSEGLNDRLSGVKQGQGAQKKTFDCLRSDQKTNRAHVNGKNRACKGGAQTCGDGERMVAQQNKEKHKRHQERVMEI